MKCPTLYSSTLPDRRLLMALLFLSSLLLLPAVAPAETQDEATSGDEAASETDAPPEDFRFYAYTTVTATGTEADAFRLPTPVTVIETPTLRQPDSAADLLRYEPGVDVNGVGPNQSRPIIRGQRGLRILFLEDGLRMNNARRQTDFGEIPGLVDLESVDRLEVVRGPASVLYGSDAIGGVLNLVTEVPRSGEALSGSVSTRYSTADEQVKGNLSLDGQGEHWSWALGYTYRDAEDYEAASGSYGAIDFADEVTVTDSGVQDDSLVGFLGYRFDDRHAVFARFNRYRADDTGFGFVDNALLPDTGEGVDIRILYPFQRFDKYSVGYQGSALGAALADTVDFQLYYQQNERELVNDILIDIGPLFPGAPNSSVQADTFNYTDLETWGSRTEVTKILGTRHVLTYGLEYWADDSFNTDFSTTTTTLRFPFPPFAIPIVETDDVANAPNAENRSFGLFVQDEILATDRFKAILGARYQNVETRANETPGWDITGLDFDDDAIVGAVNLLYAVTDTFHLVGSWGTAFRAPNIVERLFNGLTPEGVGFQVLNPDLVSEESENFDLGFKYQSRRSYLELFYFENDIEDGVIQYFLSPAEIAQLPQATQDEIAASGVTFVVQQRNLDQLQYEGVELSGGYRFDSGLSVGGNFSYLEGKRVDSTNPPTGDSYSDKLVGWVRWEPSVKPYRLEYRVRHNGSEELVLQQGEPIPAVGPELPSFTVHSLMASYSFAAAGSEHTLSLLVDNATDELYAEFSNATFFRPQPKRNWIVSYQLAF